ncbi:MAG: I78 family peptidase inhibitor [Phenylobacterium sp.]|uniref:I78 family peptidase inhibitor n=1 Tax=Phenylobacterium sp. TaxID=1871053 RepID=UPI0027340072|nr:I78 family peptidase inhibitor [Phenylobacterium sp.]MDP3173972.1 I78 family peptidase inhibitor [Phenylobacterium sp.]
MRRIIVAGCTAGLLALAGCAAPLPEAPPVALAPPPSPAPVRDECGAQALQSLIGRPRTEIPVPVLPALQRVACTSCAVTQDYNPRRLNFFFEADSGLIAEIKCG